MSSRHGAGYTQHLAVSGRGALFGRGFPRGLGSLVQSECLLTDRSRLYADSENLRETRNFTRCYRRGELRDGKGYEFTLIRTASICPAEPSFPFL